MRRFSFAAVIITLLIFPAHRLFAQGKDSSQEKKTIIISHADRFTNEKKDTSELFSATGNVVGSQGTTLFYCDSMVQDRKHNTVEAFGHVHINDNDSVHTYSDYMKYIGADRQTFLKKNVKLTDGRGVLTTNDLSYNLNSKLGIYLAGGKLVNDSTTLTSTEAYYHGDTRDVTFKKKVKLVNPQYTVTTDTLLYNTYTKVATFTVPTVITGKDKQQIHTTDGYYDMLNKKSYFGKRSELVDDSTSLVADDIVNDSSGYSEAAGNVFIRDLKQGYTLIANNVKSNKKEGSFLATQKPVLIIKQDADSIFVAADTFYSAHLSALRKERNVPDVLDTTDLKKLLQLKPDSARDRFIEGYYHVHIFSDSLQAVGDSLFYSSEDSVFRLFKNPVLWAQESQITGDTIYLFTQDKKPKRMYAFENGLVLNRVGKDSFYNQVKGRTINGYFKNGQIDYVRARGGAENVYYALDEQNKYIGVNKSSAGAIDTYFENKKPQRVKWISDVQGNMSPMGQVNHEEIKLKGFRWLDNIRPKSRYDLFGETK
ncbi:OstA-like protein [Deminuibacter soli]|uniref:Organic solvent tolerance-like N-terminal domain-containing protein n=1 Tax=Deminuibacter soli TaxID=2291815 RepID=A0A3E1NGW5_9BACT|nr:OstA-like protein [Deminuibacter soli]RFM27101.1 hypothetical protein DXN05_16680 [Deminuibacter soli]